jgi:2,3-bisphosphoglycerate-dependent phosphoglycerate mutase
VKFGGRYWARPPMGESRFDVSKRVHQSFSEYKEDYEESGISNLIIVTHGGL